MTKRNTVFWITLLMALLTLTFNACDKKEEMLGDRMGNPVADSADLAEFYVGGDLSYTSEMEKRA